MKWALALLCSCLLAFASGASAVDCNSSFGSTAILRSQLNALCDPTQSSPLLPGCTLWQTCTGSNALASPLCDPTVVFATLCSGGASGTGTCQKFKAGFSSLSAAEACLQSKAVTLPTNDVSINAIEGMCSVHNMTGCAACGDGTCTDPLGTYSAMCLEMKMSQCTDWITMCTTVGANNSLGPLCASGAPPPAPSSPCLTNNSLLQCASYQYPDTASSADMEALCQSMPSMSACSIWSSCKASELKGVYCEPFNALASACQEMPSMSQCANYKKLCMVGTTAVQQCSNYPGIPRLPSYSAAEQASQTACSQMSMSSCSLCTTAPGGCPNPLQALTAICKEMDNSMSECGIYQSWCDVAGANLGPYCTMTSTDIPPMTMWLHQRVAEVVLSIDWITRTPAAYAGTIIAILAFGVVSTALKVARGRFDAQWIHDSLCSHAGARRAAAAGACCSKHAEPRTRLQKLLALTATQNFIRALLTGGSSLLDYLNMLIVMTFNVGFLIAAVGGYMLGTVLLSHLVVPQQGRQTFGNGDDRSSGSGGWLQAGAMKLRGSGESSRKDFKDVEQGHMPVASEEASDPGSASGSGSVLGGDEGGCPACSAYADDAAQGHTQDQRAARAEREMEEARASAYHQAAAVHHASDGCC